MVHALDEDQWRQLIAFANVYGKGSLQLQLLELLRSMDTYDHILERDSFRDHALITMRRSAKEWLIRTVRRLALYQSEVMEQVLDIDVLIRWGLHEETSKFIARAKLLAKKEEEFIWLGRLLEYEIKLAKLLYQGEEKSTAIEKSAIEAKQNAFFLSLKADIEIKQVQFLEAGRNQLLENGIFDESLTERYFKSAFAKQEIGSWPICLQIEKLRIDEALFYFVNDIRNASTIAEEILRLTTKLEKVRDRSDENRSKIMFRLSSYYSELGSTKKLMSLISEFRLIAQKTSVFRLSYVQRALHTFFHTAFDYKMPELALEGAELWTQNQSQLREMPKEIVGFRTLIYLGFYYISISEYQAAKRIYLEASMYPKLNLDLGLKIIFKILHLIILLEEKDDRGMDSYWKNYKRHIKAQLPSTIAEAGLEIGARINQISSLETPADVKDSFDKLVRKLALYEESSKANLRPFIYPMSLWAKLRRGS